MEKTVQMIEFEEETGGYAIVTVKVGFAELQFPSEVYVQWVEAELLKASVKAAAYDRVMSGGKFTMKEMANIKKLPVTIDKDGTINAHGAIPHLARGGFAGFTDCWVNNADDYAEIDESFVEIPEGLDWTTSLTLPDGWEEK